MTEQSEKPHVVRFENLVKTYFSGEVAVPVLKGVDLLVSEGEFVGIMGTSGSGKSTMLNILGLLDVPTSGKYHLMDIEVQSMSDNKLAELRNNYIGFIFQSFNLFTHLNVEQNIEVPMIYAGVPKNERRETARAMAGKVGLGHRLTHRPSQLSGGECQRTAIARALANKPAFLLADEPTGNLDEKTSNEIIALFHELHKTNRMTIIMVTHNPALEPQFDRVVRMRDGRVQTDAPVIHGEP